MKQLLMDQKFISGLGNIYSDEVLFAAGLRYDRVSATLSSQEVRRLYRAMQETLQEAIKLRGTTLGDEAYVDLFGKPGEYQAELKVLRTGGRAVPPVPDADPNREGVAAHVVFLPAVPELTGRHLRRAPLASASAPTPRSPLPAPSRSTARIVADRRDRIAEPAAVRDGLHVVRRQSADREPFDVVLLEEALERGRLGLPAQRVALAERAGTRRRPGRPCGRCRPRRGSGWNIAPHGNP